MADEHLSDTSSPLRSGISLAEFFRDYWPHLDIADKFRETRSLAEFLKDAHDRGWRHRSLGAATIAVTKVGNSLRFSFAIGAARRLFPRALGEAQRIDELAGVYAGLLPRCGRAEAVRFLRSYLSSADRREVRRWLLAVQRLALTKALARWRRQGRLSLGTNGEFVHEAEGRFKVYRLRDSAAREALSTLLPDPDRLLAQGEVMPGRGNSCVAAKVCIGGRLYILKRYNCRGWVYRLRHVFRRSRALRTWLAAQTFRLRGVPLPKQWLCLEERSWRLLGRSYTLTEYFEGASRLSDLYSQQSRERRRVLLARLGMVLGKLHRFLGIHGDTNWDNILVRPEGDDFAIALVDLDGSRILPWRRPNRLAKDIWHFVRDMQRRGGNRQPEIDFFLYCWSRWSGWQGRFPFKEDK